jgi:hypothetical protein
MTPTVTAAEIIDVVRGLLAARGGFDVEDGLFVEADDVTILVIADEALPVVIDLAQGGDEVDPDLPPLEAGDNHRALDLLVTVRAGGVLGLAGTPVTLLGAGGRLVGELDERGHARIAGVLPGRALLEVGPLRGLADVLPLHQRRREIEGVLDPPVALVSRELSHAAQTGRRVGPAQHWRSLDGALTIELAESDERRLLLTVSRRAESVDVAAVRVRWDVRARDEGSEGPVFELVTPLVPGFGGRRTSVRYDLGSAEVFASFGIVAVDTVPLAELTEGDLDNALHHGPYGSALRSWQVLAALDSCPQPVAARIAAELGRP